MRSSMAAVVMATPRPARRTNRGFPLRAVLIGAGIGCGVGVYMGHQLAETREDQPSDSAKGCLGGAAFGTLIALPVAQ